MKGRVREETARRRTALQERLETLRWESRERLVALRAGIEERRAGLIRGASERTASLTVSASAAVAPPPKADFLPLRPPGASIDYTHSAPAPAVLPPPVIAPPGPVATPSSSVTRRPGAPPAALPGAPGPEAVHDGAASSTVGTLFSSGPPVHHAPEPPAEENPVGELVADLLDRIGGDRLELTDEERRVLRKRLYKWIKDTTPDEVETALAEVMTSHTIPPLLRERLVQAAADEVHPSIVKAAQVAARSKAFRRAIGKTRIGKYLPMLMKLVPAER